MTSGRKRNYVVKRNAFKRVKAQLERDIEKRKVEIERLEREIDRLRPQTKHGTEQCYECECISMKQIDAIHFKCEICGLTSSHYGNTHDI